MRSDLSIKHMSKETQMETTLETTLETAPHAGDKQFAGAIKTSDPAPQGVGTFRYRLSLNGAPIGWLGKGGSQNIWALVVPDENDAVILQRYAYGGANYLTIPGFGYMTWSGSLSGNPVAFNTWAYANGWKEEGSLLIAVDSGAPLSVYRSDVPWLYANPSYSVVGVTRKNV
jgi:hypothetical protein